jgi:hypothetical protein
MFPSIVPLDFYSRDLLIHYSREIGLKDAGFIIILKVTKSIM